MFGTTVIMESVLLHLQESIEENVGFKVDPIRTIRSADILWAINMCNILYLCTHIILMQLMGLALVIILFKILKLDR